MQIARALKGILLLAALSAVCAAQSGMNCRLVGKETCVADMARVNAALKSAESAWSFITSPEAGYFERLIVAQRCVNLMGASWIPEILRAKRELMREAATHRFGVLLSSLDSRWTGSLGRDAPPGAGTKRNILGHEFVVPQNWIEYPATDEALMRAPWAYQVAGIVGAHYDYGVGGLYLDVAAHSDPAEVAAIALALPCEDYQTALDLVDLTLIAANATRSASPAVFGTWLNAMHNHQGQLRVEQAALGIMDKAARAIHPAQADDAWAMLQVLGLAELARGDGCCALGVFDGIGYLHPVPNTLMVAAARYLADSKEYWLDRKHWANLLFDAPGDHPFADSAPLFNKDGRRSADFEAQMASYRTWLVGHEAGLEEKAAKERAAIERAREKMAGVKACSATD